MWREVAFFHYAEHMGIIGGGMGWILPEWGSSLNSYVLRMVGKLFSYLVGNVLGDFILGGD